jgi:hypothetical protein
MKAINAMGRVSGAPPLRLLVMVTWVLGLAWFILMVLSYVSPVSGQNDVIAAAPFFMVIACGLLAGVGAAFAKSLGAGARVLGQRQVPTYLWRCWLQIGLKTSLVQAGFLVLVIATFSLPTSAPWHGLTAAAVVSTVMGVSVVRGLAFQGLAPRVGVWSAQLLVVLLLVGSVVSGGLTAVWRWIDNWPWIILLGIVASWSMLALTLTRRWLGQVPQVRTHGAEVQLNLWKKVKVYARRYTVLTSWAEVAVSGPNVTRRSVFQVMFWPLYLFLPPNMLTPSWGHGVPVWHVWVLGILAQLASGFLVCKDLHWRMLLAPAGLRRGALGWHIARSTATVSISGPLIVVGVFGAAALAFLPTSSFAHDVLTPYLARIGIAPLYLIFVISVGTLIRGAQHTGRWQWGLVTLWSFAGIVALVWGWINGAPLLVFKAALFTVDYSYAFALLVLSALAVWASNRLWNVDKLLRCAPK